MDSLKGTIAKTVQDYVIEQMEFLQRTNADESVSWEAQPITSLTTQIKVWPAQGGPRYFNVIVKETHKIFTRDTD